MMENWEEMKSLEEKDKKYLWHPFTQMQDWVLDRPVVIKEGRGNYLIDLEGNRYLDGVSSLWVNLHGHRKKAIDRAITAQLRKIAHSTLLGLANVPSIQLAESLIQWATKSGMRSMSRVFYSDNGSTAVEVALKMAFQYWQHRSPEFRRKTLFLTLQHAYHGDTIGSVSLGGMDLFHKTYKPLLFRSLKASSPHCYRCPLDKTYPDCRVACADEVGEILQANADRVAAMVLEPGVQAAAGMIPLPDGYLKRIRELCTRYGVFLIADEVATGFGRTGRMFACEQEGVTPDFLTLAKGITGGYLPLAVTLTTEEVYRGFLGEYGDFKTFFHGHSYTGNPLGCAAALANLEVFEKEKVLEKLPEKIKTLAEQLKPLYKIPIVGDIRQKGLMVGIELVRDKKTKEPFSWEAKMGVRVCRTAREMGVLLRPLGNVVVLMPPLSITSREVKKMVQTVSQAILCHLPPEGCPGDPQGPSGFQLVTGKHPDG